MAASSRSVEVPDPGVPPGGYDALAIPNGNGEFHHITRAAFEELPLAERVRLLLGGRLRFFRKGAEITAREALRGA
jgi:hypothetical protein